MKTKYIEISLNQAQANLAELCDAVISKREIAIIKRPGGLEVALLAASELSALVETLYLLGSPRNAVRLVRALRRAQRRSEIH